MKRGNFDPVRASVCAMKLALLLHQSVQRSLLGAVALVVERRAVRRPLGLPASGVHDGLPKG